MLVEYSIGLAFAIAIAAAARAFGFDRDRSFYPTLLIVIAALYVLFAAMAASATIIAAEVAFSAAFAVCAVVGHQRASWLVASALASHGVFDLVHARFVENSGVPRWWPGFCAAADLVLAVGALVRRPGPQ
jgi:hypothetical protein